MDALEFGVLLVHDGLTLVRNRMLRTACGLKNRLGVDDRNPASLAAEDGLTDIALTVVR